MQFYNNSQILDLAAKRYEELKATQNMTRADGLMKGLPFDVNVVSGDQHFKVTAYYKPWVGSIKVHDVQVVTLTAEEVEAIKNPPVQEVAEDEATEEVQDE